MDEHGTPYGCTRNPETGGVVYNFCVDGTPAKPPTPEQLEDRKRYIRHATADERRKLFKWVRRSEREKKKAAKDDKKTDTTDLKENIAKDDEKHTPEVEEASSDTKPYQIELDADDIAEDLDFMREAGKWYMKQHKDITRMRRELRKSKKKARAEKTRTGRNPTEYNGGSSRVQARPSK